MDRDTIKVIILLSILGAIIGVILAKKKLRTTENVLTWAGLTAVVLAIWFY